MTAAHRGEQGGKIIANPFFVGKDGSRIRCIDGNSACADSIRKAGIVGEIGGDVVIDRKRFLLIALFVFAKRRCLFRNAAPSGNAISEVLFRYSAYFGSDSGAAAGETSVDAFSEGASATVTPPTLMPLANAAYGNADRKMSAASTSASLRRGFMIRLALSLNSVAGCHFTGPLALRRRLSAGLPLSFGKEQSSRTTHTAVKSKHRGL